MTSIEDKTRQSVAAFLPEILDRALLSYAAFAAAEAPTEGAKDFAAHHTACKTAVAHIELLIKLARWADLEDAAREAEAQRALIAAELAAAAREAGEEEDGSDPPEEAQ